MELRNISNNNFPSEFAPMSEKLKDEWGLKFSEAFHKEGKNNNKYLYGASDKYQKLRELAEGRQSEEYYKGILNARKRAGKEHISWRNSDYRILPIAPKFVKILVNKILSEPQELKIKAIDPFSVNQERKRKNEIIAHMAMKDLNEKLSEAGVPIASPFEEGEVTPSTIREVDLYLEAYPKNKHVSELYDEINLWLNTNNWEKISRKIANDEVKIGIFGTWVYLDPRGNIKITRIKPENFISNPVEENDFSDMTRGGHYVPMTIGEIRIMANGKFNEEQLAEIASKASGKNYYPVNRNEYYSTERNFGNYTAPYDTEKVIVLHWVTKSVDRVEHVVLENEYGEIKLEKPENLQGQELPETIKTNSIINEIDNVYEGWWIVDTKYMLSYGLQPNMQRYPGSLSETHLGINLYTLDFDSIIRQIEPVLNSIQTNWLQHLHHTAKSIPDGVAINKRALTEITIGGKGGVVLDKLDLIEQYMQTGTLLYNDIDGQGRPISKPFEISRGGTNDKASYHFNMVFQGIELIRNILGLNEITDASTPNPEIGKAVSELANTSTNTALGDLYYGFKFISEETAKSIARLVPIARKFKNRGLIEALGEESQLYWEQNSDMGFVDFGISINVGWNEKDKEDLIRAAEQNLKTAGGTLMPQDTIFIKREKNPEKAYMLLEAKTKQRQKELQQESLMLQEANAKAQQESAMVAEQMKQQTLQMELESKMQMHGMEIERLTHEYQLKMMLAKLEKGMELDNNEKERYLELIKSREKNRTQIAITAMMAKNKEKQMKKAG